MRPRGHLKLFLIVSVAWFLFWLAGLPDYYRQYSDMSMALFDLAILPPIWFIVYSSARKARKGKALAVTLWLSFYISIPLLLYDLLYCGIHLGCGVRFLWEYWYLTIYYILPWLIFPLTGWMVDRSRALKAA